MMAYPARAGGPWLCRTLVRSGFHAVVVPSGLSTSVSECVLLCSFHHQVVIHRWGWTLVLNPDGTTTAWNPDRTKVLHSHGPPARAG